MPKVTITFNLPEDNDEYIIYNNAMNWALTLYELDNVLRSAMKHGHEHKTADDALEAIRETLHAELSAHDVSLDMIR